MYLLVMRRMTQAAVASASDGLPTSRRESAGETRRRFIRQSAVQLILLGVYIVVFPTMQIAHRAVGVAPAFASDAALSGAFIMLAICRWLRSWENGHSACLLREPRYRWTNSKRAWGLGRGNFEPQDFYVIDRGGL